MEPSWHPAQGWCPPPQGRFLAPVRTQVFSNERVTCASVSLPPSGPPVIPPAPRRPGPGQRPNCKSKGEAQEAH